MPEHAHDLEGGHNDLQNYEQNDHRIKAGHVRVL